MKLALACSQTGILPVAAPSPGNVFKIHNCKSYEISVNKEMFKTHLTDQEIFILNVKMSKLFQEKKFTLMLLDPVWLGFVQTMKASL